MVLSVPWGSIDYLQYPETGRPSTVVVHRSVRTQFFVSMFYLSPPDFRFNLFMFIRARVWCTVAAGLLYFRNGA